MVISITLQVTTIYPIIQHFAANQNTTLSPNYRKAVSPLYPGSLPPLHPSAAVRAKKRPKIAREEGEMIIGIEGEGGGCGEGF